MTRRPIGLAAVVVVVGLLSAVFAGPPASARAHGMGTPQLLNVPAGPYMLSVWTDPNPLRSDEAHVVVAVIAPDTGQMIVSDIEVTITMTSLADPTVVHQRTAGQDFVNQLLHAAEFNDHLTEGAWRVGISATGARGASDEIAFEVEIDPARGFRWLWIGGGGLAAVVLAWLLLSMQEEKPVRMTRSRRRQRSARGKPAGG